VKEIEGVNYKLVCCRIRCPKLPTTTALPEPDSEWHILLYDTMTDPNDLHSLHDFRTDIVEYMKDLLPPGWCRDRKIS
jgi:hypothetical protein